MKNAFFCRRNAGATVAVGALLLSLGGSGCALDDTDQITWEEFRQQATRVVDGQEIYVVDWDIAVTLDELRERYDRLSELEPPSEEPASTAQPLIVNTVDGNDDLWTNGQEHELTYCVSDDFGDDQDRAIREMADATRSWQLVADVRFVYVPAENGACDNGNTNVVFAVRPWTGGGACAFFPSGGGCVSRTVVIDFDDLDTNPFYQTNAPNITTTGVFRHELGHVLGFRHEHTRSDSGTCFENNEWRELGTYDARSVMHYNWCNGVTASDLTLTTLDQRGAGSVYGQSRIIVDGTAADFNGDGRSDLALTGPAGWGTLPLARSTGRAEWNVTNLTIPSFARWAAREGAMVVKGDYDGDGRTDIAITGPAGWGTLPVAFSGGGGAFRVRNVTIPNFARWAATANVRAIPGDFNGDGRTDIALTGGATWGTVPVAFSRGDGSFQVTNERVGSFARWARTPNVKVIAGDFDGDGRTDLALTGGGTWGTIPVALSRGDGVFQVTNFGASNFARWARRGDAQILAGDFNGDGRTDLGITGPSGWGTLPVALSVGGGRFDVRNLEIENFARWASVDDVTALTGDFNGDGRTDVALVGGDTWGTIPVAYSRGNGGFTVINQPARNFARWAALGTRPMVGDYDGDGRSDLALIGAPTWGTAPVALSRGFGGFEVENNAVGGFAGWAARGGVRVLH